MQTRSITAFILGLAVGMKVFGATVDLSTYPLTKVTTKVVDEGVAYDGNRKVGQIALDAGKEEGAYVLCRVEVNERSRNPRWTDPANDYAGYRLVAVNSKMALYQWWVMPWGRYFDRQNFWLVADFVAHWIRRDASTKELEDNGCKALPAPDTTRTWPADDSRGTAPAAPAQPAAPHFTAILRMYCRATDGGIANAGTYEARVISPTSCKDAMQVAEQRVASKDRCEQPSDDPNGTRYKERYSGKREWVSTNTCP